MGSREKKTSKTLIKQTVLICFITVCLTIGILSTSYQLPQESGIDTNHYQDILKEKENKKKTKKYHKVLGQAPISNSTYRHFKRVEGVQHFDVQYRFGDDGNRINDYPKGQDKHLVLLGGSNTFGEGLDHNQDFGAQLQAMLPSYHVYNYAYRGYGPNQALARCEILELSQRISPKEGLMIFQHFYYMPYRILGLLPYLRWSWGSAPKYYFNISQEKWIYRGLFKDSYFNKIVIRLLNHPWLRPISSSKLISLSDEDLRQYTIALKQLENCYKKSFPKNDFIITLAPFHNKKLYESLKKHFHIYQLNYWEWTNADYKDSYKLKDGHLSKEGVRYLSQKLKERIIQNRGF